MSPLGDGGMQPPVKNSGDVPLKIVIFKGNECSPDFFLDLPIFPKKGQNLRKNQNLGVSSFVL